MKDLLWKFWKLDELVFEKYVVVITTAKKANCCVVKRTFWSCENEIGGAKHLMVRLVKGCACQK